MNQNTKDTIFSSASEDWATPRVFMRSIHEEFHPTLDVCASAANTTCARFFDKDLDGLTQPWTGVCWMNPPYGRAIGQWLAKAAQSAREGATVICLLPARTDTRWWHTCCQPILKGETPGEVRFVKGRLHFNESPAGAPFPSVLVVFRPTGER